MAEQKLVNAVREIERSTQQLVIGEAARKALQEGTNEALTRALILAREAGMTLHVVTTANEALGFKKD